MPTLPYWLFPGDDRPTEEIDDEIVEELRLHLDLMAEESERHGLAPGEAKRQAAERFGDFNQLLRRCRREKQGDMAMLRRMQAVLIGVLTLAVTGAGWSQWQFANDLLEQQLKVREELASLEGTLNGIQGKLEQAIPKPIVVGSNAPRYYPVGPVSGLGPHGEVSELSPPESIATLNEEGDYTWVKLSPAGSDLRGVVTDSKGKPVADAHVLLIVKTWPNNRYRQKDFALETDETGRFGIGGVIPFNGQYGVNAAVVAEGHAIASRYVFVKEAAGEGADELSFELTPSKLLRIVVTDAEGKPIAKALVGPSARVTEDDKEYLVYHQGSNPVWKKTDEEGAVTVDWFAAGDLAKVNIRPRGGDWQEKKFDVPDKGTVTLTAED